jgi:hypothetical protein
LINYGIGSYPKRGSVLPPVSKNTKQFIKVLASFSRKMSIKIIKKQELKKLSMSKITVSNLNNITGGAEIQILSIGEQCSIDNSCGRLSRRGDLRCSDCQNPAA